MNFDKEFFENVEILSKYKTKPDLNIFFETIYKLEQLVKEINNEILGNSTEFVKLEKQAQILTKKLEDHKDNIARHTKTQKEYDAVYDCIDYLESHFNNPK
jgi:hypothetical protein